MTTMTAISIHLLPNLETYTNTTSPFMFPVHFQISSLFLLPTSFLFQVTLLCSYFLCYPHHSTLFPLPFRNDSNAVTANIPVEPLSVLKPTNDVSSSIPLSSLFQMTGNRIWLSDHLITVPSNIYINIVRHTKQNTYSIHLNNWYLPRHNHHTCTLFV
mgnify:CR=1 FL=1